MIKVKIYDAIMGSGKTHDAIERMKLYLIENRKFIYITPFKSEITRVLHALNSHKVYAPVSKEDNDEIAFELNNDYINEKGEIDLNTKPEFKSLNKRAQFLKMASNGDNIIATHALFMALNKEDYDLFSEYILILDEVVTPLETYRVGRKDIEILLNQELIFVDDNTNQVKFIQEDYNDKAFRDVKTMCKNRNVFYLDKHFFVWVFPIEIFKEFKEIQILTYLFKGSLLAPYFKMYKIEYALMTTETYEEINNYKKLLNIYNGRSNNVVGLNSFSKTWTENLSSRNAKKISNTVSNLFKRVFETKSSENAYTTFKSCKSKLSGKGYTKGFIPINARATNDFSNKKSMAYLGNRYHNPQTINFFKERNIILDEELWALSELLQWIWRGCIRENKKMNLYIPNQRMRVLLLDWLDGKYNINSSKLKVAI